MVIYNCWERPRVSYPLRMDTVSLVTYKSSDNIQGSTNVYPLSFWKDFNLIWCQRVCLTLIYIKGYHARHICTYESLQASIHQEVVVQRSMPLR